MRVFKLVAVLILGSAAGSAEAHHSFAPHFDVESMVTISGKIVAFQQRNPHSYIHIESENDSGGLDKYVCESSGITQLRRNGIDADLLRIGSTVTVTGEQHRRDRYKCFFRTVQIENGPVLSIDGAGARLEEQVGDTMKLEASGLFGNWLLVTSGNGAGNGESYDEMLDYMTEDGQRAEANYDPFRDDPVYNCRPIGLRRVWLAPETPVEIVLQDDRVLISYEWMDVKRVVFLNSDNVDTGSSVEVFGRSIGRIDNGVLTIETDSYPAGIIRQYLGINNEPPFRGLLHSDKLTTTEILRYDDQRESLEVTMLFKDPGFYSQGFPPVTTRYEKTDLELRPFGCMPEN